MKNVVKFTGRFFAAVAAIVFIFGCKAEVSDSEKDYKGETGSISVSFAEGAEARDSRALMISELKSAKAVVIGFDSKGEKFTKTSGVEALTGGKADSISVTDIPVCKNAAVVVTAYSDTTGISEVKGGVISAYVEKIEGGKNNPIEVKWETSKKGNVYAALIEAGVNTNILSDAQISSINNAIPTDIHAILINADEIAAAAKAFVEGTGTLGAASSYKLTAGSVKVTCNDYNGMTLQLTDPLSETATASTSGAVTISNVAPGTWTLYVLDGTTVKTSKSVTVTGGEESSVSVGSTTFDGIQIQVAKSLGYNQIYYWACSDETKYPKPDWPGIALISDWCEDDYIYNFEGCSSVNLLITKGAGDKLCSSDIKITKKGSYRITSSGASDSTYISDVPPEPVAPTVKISPSNGSKIALNGSISVTFDDGNDTITSAKVTVNGTEYDMGTSAGTWSKSLSDMGITSEGASVNVAATVTNSVGTGSASASLTTKEANKLVTNPNELRIYQVMVASFQDGDPSIGYSQMWGPDNALKGGDLQGIINALDYIENLGCNALWMTPIFQSNTGDEKLKATGYFANDYFNVDNHFGTNEKFAELVEACHEKGIAVILDGVFGHNAGYQLVASPNRNGILNPGITPSSSNPVDYAGNENSLKYYSDVARYWITEYKIDGWRFDQCYQVGLGDKDNNSGKFPINTGAGGHNYWYDIRKVIEEASASNGTKGVDWGTLGYMVGEHWHGDQTVIQMGSVNAGYTSSSYGDMSKAASGYGLNGCFDFPSYYKVIQGFAQEWGGTTTGNITTGLSYLYKTYSEKGYSCKDDDGTYDVYYPNFMLSNHDLYRIGDLIKKKFSCEYDSEEYTKRNKVLLAAQCAYSGPITIYYGDEIGDHSVDLSGWGGDNVARSSGKITGFNTREQAIHDWTQKCLEARADHEALWNGTNTQITGQSDFYVAKKEVGGETIYIAFNYNSSSSKTFSASGTDLISGQTYSGTVTVPALSAVYILAN